MGKLCQYCNKREAKIHFTEIKDGKQTEMHICEQCAHEKNVALAFPSLLSHIVQGGPGAPAAESDAVPASCPNCALTYAEFKAKGRLGCSTCYEVFAPVLVPLLEKVHGTAKHAGTAPDRMEELMASRQTQREVDSLQAQLDRAIAAEEYEKAAALRDEIREMKGDQQS